MPETGERTTRGAWNSGYHLKFDYIIIAEDDKY